MESSGMSETPPLWYIGHHDTGRVDPVDDHVLHRAQDANYDMLTSPLTTPIFQSNVQTILNLYHAELDQGSLPEEIPVPLIPAFTPADTPLLPQDSLSQLLITAAPWMDLASPDPIIFNLSRQILNLEIAYAAFCGIQNVLVPGPTLYASVLGSSMLTQYARAIKEALTIGPYVQFHILLPMIPSNGKPASVQPHLSDFARISNDEDLSKSADPWSPWEAWNLIRSVCKYNGRLSVAISLPKHLPSSSIQSRWCCEPVRMLFIPESTFVPNRMGQPVLSKGHKALITRCMRLRTPPWILLSDIGALPASSLSSSGADSTSPATGPDGWPLPSESKSSKSIRDDPTPHLSYIRYLQRNQSPRSQIEAFGAGYQDYLQAPLQPLADNLESITYEVFEKDPIKYEWYERAIYHALKDWNRQDKPTSSGSDAVVIAVAGSGRGPLVTRALRAAQQAEVPVQVWAVEKNPNAYVLLQGKNITDWNKQVTVVKTDMRAWKGPCLPDGTHGHVDIIVSELLGSFADNELSPECLDGVQHVLNPNYGISIPSSYTAHLTPIATPKIYADILSKSGSDPGVFEVPYVVMLHAHDFLSITPKSEAALDSSVAETKTDGSLEPQSDLIPFNSPDVQICWEFEHPAPPSILARSKLRSGGSATGGWGGALGGDGANEHNARAVVLNFKCKNRGTCHGLAGYFETVLYEGDDDESTVELSTNPVTMDSKSKDMISWFPIFFPLKVPVSFPDDSELQISVWRQTDDRKVWYEWLVESFVHVAEKRLRLGVTELHSSKKSGCLM
ncbi:hypothetical protein BLS_002713 [Venturia inaequalis]|uniref:Protein arginine N-methyltransferase n=1 Tax=Venturia inaequalis TaxID=5025 RepID=A0A8H3UTJ2_VENIN|nr:hypothetical protein BLS_002713 [Venturia inaequalis]